MKNRFTDNNKAVGCSGERRTKKHIKEDIAREKNKLAELKQSLDNLGQMHGNYAFNQQNVEHLVGCAFIAIEQIKSRVKQLKKELKDG